MSERQSLEPAGTYEEAVQRSSPATGLSALEIQSRPERLAFMHLQGWLRTESAVRWMLIAVLIVGAYLRLSHLNWDQGTHIHPDERFLTMVEDALRLPESLGQFFDSTASPMNPYNKGYGFFVYGTLPIFIVKVVAEFANKLNQVARIWTSAPDVPIYLIGYDGVHFVGRALSGLFDLAGVWLTYVIGRRLYSWKVGLLAAALLAFAVLPLQQSHFFTVDTFGTFFSLLTFYFAVRVAQGGQPDRRGGGWGTYIALGASLGASVACRINLAPLAGIALLAAGVRAWDDWHREGSRNGVWLSTLLQATLFRLLLMAIVALAVFRVAQPYAFGGKSFLDFTLSQQWRDNMKEVSALISGDRDYPPGHQWASRTPFVFPFVNMVVWGMGLPLGLTAWAGWALAAWQIIRGLTIKPDPAAVRAHLLPVVWIGGMFLWQGMQYVQSMRYLLPLYPILAMMAAWLLWWLVDKARSWKLEARSWKQEGGGKKEEAGSRKDKTGSMEQQAGSTAAEAAEHPASSIESATSSHEYPPRSRGIEWPAVARGLGTASSIQLHTSRFLVWAAYGLMGVVLVATMLWGWGFLAIYRRPLTRLTASEWMYDNIPPGSVIANEHWDDPLPLRVQGKDAFGSYGYKGLSTSSDGLMQMYSEDVPEKRELLYQWLNQADYIVLSSNRLWGSIPRLPMRYPMTTEYYKLLFEGKLGFEQVLRTTSFPTIFGIQFDDTKAEEAFSVYDHPEVRVFRKTPAYSEALVRSYLEPIDLENTIQMWPKQVSAAPTALLFTPGEAAVEQAGGTWSKMFGLTSLLSRSQVLSVVVWLLALVLLGLIAFPLAFVVLRGLSDRGYAVSKVLGLLLLAWLSWIGPSLKLAPYERWWIAWCLALMIVVSGAVAWRHRSALAEFWRQRSDLLMAEEVLFLALFGLFLLIRWGNPDLWHPARGGEKPMDFAYLNAVMKSTFFPPYDPWHSGGFLNYYYFGFVIVGTLIKLTGIVPWVAYNLAVPSLFAMTGLGAFCVAFNLADRDPATVLPGDDGSTRGGPIHSEASNALQSNGSHDQAPGPKLRAGSMLAGLAGAFFVAVVGNLGNVKLLLDQFAARSTGTVQSTIPGMTKLVNALQGMVAVATGKATLDFPNDWWFWNASRVIPDTINEFPFFTFTYADLHAHMIALPLTLLGLATAVSIVGLVGLPVLPPTRQGGQNGVPHGPGDRDGGNQRDQTTGSEVDRENRGPSPWRISLPELLLILLMGFVVGALRATNTWDFPTYVLIGMIAMGILEATRRLAMPFPEALNERLAFLFRAAVAVLWRTVILVAVASVLFYPYTSNYATAYAGLQRYREATTKIPDYLTVHGFFLALVVIYLLSELAVQRRERRIPRWIEAIVPVIVIVVVVLVGAGWILKARIWLVAMPIAALAVVLAFGRELPPARRFALLLIALALAITMGVEVIRQKDDIGRMNTVFKFYLQAWVLFGVASAFGLASWIPRALNWRPGWRRLAWAVTLVLFLGVMLYPPFAARAKVRDRFSAEDSPHTLDGMAYMDKGQYFDNNRDMRLADDKAAILWMLENVAGSPVILEGVTPGYRWGNRYSIYTGLPAVQGWDWHQKQQRSVVPSTDIDRRLAHVQEIYSTTDVARAQHLLDYYGVHYIVVGELERAYYSPEGLAKFDALVDNGNLELVYPSPAAPGSEGSTVRIYRVVGRGAPNAPSSDSFIGPQPVPTPTPLGARDSAQMPGSDEGVPGLPSAEPFLSPEQ